MAPCLYIVIVAQLLISETISSYPYYYPQRPTQQVRYPTYKDYYQSSYPNYYPFNIRQTPAPVPPPKSTPPLPKLSPPPQIPEPAQLPQTAKDLASKTEKAPEKLDSNVLNNLAIALQLLIVNNLINNPPNDSKLSPVSESLIELVQKPLAAQISGCTCETGASNYQMPNAKFLSSSNFGDDGMLTMAGIGSQSSKNRGNFGLMSPYDALTNSVYSESVPGTYRKSEFVSPYIAMSAADSYKDLFSIDF